MPYNRGSSKKAFSLCTNFQGLKNHNPEIIRAPVTPTCRLCLKTAGMGILPSPHAPKIQNGSGHHRKCAIQWRGKSWVSDNTSHKLKNGKRRLSVKVKCPYRRSRHKMPIRAASGTHQRKNFFGAATDKFRAYEMGMVS